jgi:hypothetical protein
MALPFFMYYVEMKYGLHTFLPLISTEYFGVFILKQYTRAVRRDALEIASINFQSGRHILTCLCAYHREVG